MRYGNAKRGFSLIELMIAVAIVAIIVAIAVPSYTSYIRKATRGEAQQLLLNWSNNQEVWRANNTSYAPAKDEGSDPPVEGLAVPTHPDGDFTFTVTNVTASTYQLTATPTGYQANDKQAGISCDPLTLDQSNTKTPMVCW